MTYLIATYISSDLSAGGDAVYGYTAFLWVITIVYIYQSIS